MNPVPLDPERKPVLVVIGSSAGGLEALRGLLAPLPANCDLSFVVAQHLSPDHASMLRDLLARETRLLVQEVVDKGPLLPSHVYVTPPNSDVIVEGEVLRLRAPGVRGPKPLVDRLFQSAAAAFGSRCVAIILSGTGSDGAEGVRAVKSAGGRVFVQEPRSAKYSGMPVAARATGCADAVLTLDALAERLASLKAPTGTEGIQGTGESDEVDRILNLVMAATEVDLRLYKQKTILRRVTQRARTVGTHSLSAYRQLLEKEPDEIQRLMQNSLISVTSFFRDEGPFEALGEAIARQFKHGTSPLRAWVPACATGEEAYTLSILFEQYVPHRRVQVFATDLDEGAITSARRAIYTDEKVRQLPPAVVERAFRTVGRGFQVEKGIRERVIFARHDVLRDPPFMSLDLISCRNLLIYLRAAAQEEVLVRFHQALKPGGLLLLGKSEHAPGSMFQTEDRRNKVYLNRDLSSRMRRSVLTDARDMTQAKRSPEAAGITASMAHFQRKLLEAFAPAAVLTDGAFQVRETWGSIERYLTLKTGNRDMTLLALVPKVVAASLRAQIYRCGRTGRPAKGLRRPVEIQGKRVSLQTRVYPAGELHGEPLFAVAFVETQEPPQEGESTALSAPSEEHVRELEAELSTTRQNLQSLVEELETSNEELQSLNEELQSSNEELQASNEELQASNEELQSTNEELVTVNEELEHKTNEHAALIDDLETIQNSIDAPVVVVDTNGLIRQVNEAAGKTLGLLHTAPGTPLLITGETGVSARLASRIQRVLAQGKPQDWRAVINKREYIVRIRPHCGRDSSVRGALLAFHDITELASVNQRLRRSEDKLKNISARQMGLLDCLPTSVALLDAHGSIVMVNQPWRRFGNSNGLRTPDGGIGVNYMRLCEAASGPWSDEALPMAEGIRKVLAGELETFTLDYPCHGPEQLRWFRSVVARTQVNREMGAAVLHIDITDQVRLNERLGRQAAALQSACNSMFITDADGRIDWVNDAMERLCGFHASELIGRSPAAWEGPDTKPSFEAVLEACRLSKQAWQGEVWHVTKAGQRYLVKQTVTPIPASTGDLEHFVVVHEDISGHKHVEERMLYMAEHDDLTGLWNRKSFQERLDIALRRNDRATKVGLLFLDLDRFKDTNDTLGHLAGDQVLLEISRRLKQNTNADSLARFGGDEFVVVLENMRDRDQIRTVVERLLHSFTRPIEIGGRNLFISASIGVTVYPDDATTPEVMLRNADLAMYRAKAEGRRGYRFFDKRIESEINDRVEIERELNRNIGTRDLWVAFQPQWDLRSGEVIGAEALLRANAARLKGIPVGRIISIAEESGLILAIGQSVMREAVSQLARWRSQGLGLQLSVNLSAVQFHQQDVFALITESLRARNLPMSALKVEITESVLLNRSVRVRETLHALHGAGIGLVLDDFGTGYSSLSYLREFPIQAVKIDCAFLKGIGKKSNDEAIIKGIIQLAHSMGLTVIAEGVETEEQAAFLRTQSCDFAQGFLFSQALQSGDLDNLLRQNLGARVASASD
ncbi:MAG: EAL domain-containing protein [Bryobacterales bacterium]|nr:EAL domain-containing protein [Bryobacterales bacterium]